MGADFNHISYYNDNVNSHINVNFYHLSNETNPRSLALTVLEI